MYIIFVFITSFDKFLFFAFVCVMSFILIYAFLCYVLLYGVCRLRMGQ